MKTFMKLVVAAGLLAAALHYHPVKTASTSERDRLLARAKENAAYNAAHRASATFLAPMSVMEETQSGQPKFAQPVMVHHEYNQ